MLGTLTFFLLACLITFGQGFASEMSKIRTGLSLHNSGEVLTVIMPGSSLNQTLSSTLIPSCSLCNFAFTTTKLSSEVLVSKIILQSKNDTSFTLQLNMMQQVQLYPQYINIRYMAAEPSGFLIIGNQVTLDSRITNCSEKGPSLTQSMQSNTLSSNATILQVFIFLQIVPVSNTSTQSNLNLTGFVSRDGKNLIVCSPFPLNNINNTLSVSYVIHVNDSIHFIKFTSLQICTTCGVSSVLTLGFVPSVYMYGLQSMRANFSVSIGLNFKILPGSINASNSYGICQLNFYQSICPYHSTYNTITNTCQCDAGYCLVFGNQCVNCTQFCEVMISLVCVKCFQSSHSILIAGVCFCQPGYYNEDSSKSCQKCSGQCLTCRQNFASCLICNIGYVMIDGICQVILASLTQSLSQTMNNVVATLTSANTTFIISSYAQINIAIDNIPVNNPNVTILPNKIIVSFTLNGSVSTLMISQANKNSVGNKITGNTNSVVLSLKKMHYYSESEKAGLTTSCDMVSAAAQSTNIGRSILVMMGGMYMMADMIEFVNIVAYYIFIDTTLPSNLRLFLQMLYNSLQYQIIPVDTPSLFDSHNDDFIAPQIYSNYDFSLNFISDNIFPIVQLIFFLIFTTVLGRLVFRLKGENFLSRYLKNQYSPIYTNTSETLLSCHIPLCFAGATVLLDRSLNNYYKAVNFGCAVLFVFIMGFIPLFHPIYLFCVKNSRKSDTEDSYAKTKRDKSWSEVYIFSKCLLCTVLAISIPLCPALLTILLLMASSGVQVFAASKATFKSKFAKISRITYITTHALLHTMLLIIFIFNQIFYSLQLMVILGYIAIGLILFNIGHEFLVIIAELIKIVVDWIKEKIQSNRKDLLEKQKHPEQITQEMTLKRTDGVDSPYKSKMRKRIVGKSKLSNIQTVKKNKVRFGKVLRIQPKQNLSVLLKDSSPTPSLNLNVREL